MTVTAPGLRPEIGEHLKPIFVCQLTAEEQTAVKKMLTHMILHGCGNDPAKVQEYYGEPLEEAVQIGMDSKIVDLDYLMTFYAEEFQTADADGQFDRETAQTVSAILRESRNHETDRSFLFHSSGNESSVSEQEDDWER